MIMVVVANTLASETEVLIRQTSLETLTYESGLGPTQAEESQTPRHQSCFHPAQVVHPAKLH